MKAALLSLVVIGLGALLAVPLFGSGQAAPAPKPKPAVPKDAATLIVGGGCFWCIEVIFEELKGVYHVESGYAGGDWPNPTYQAVSSGRTGHAEVIKIFYDPKQISADDMLRMFFVVHDPTTLNRQGNDVGTQYRSVIFYANDEEKKRAERIKAEIEKEKLYKQPIVTTIEALKNYQTAEAYHQDYFARYETASPAERASMNAGYCAVVIEPKVRKFREKFAHLRKKAE